MTAVNQNNSMETLQEASRAVEQLTQQNLRELSAFMNPPKAVEVLMKAIGILLAPEISSNKFTWNEGRTLLRSGDLKSRLMSFDKDRITAEQVTRLATYITNDAMQPVAMNRVSIVGANLLMWVRAMYQYAQSQQTTTSQ